MSECWGEVSKRILGADFYCLQKDIKPDELAILEQFSNVNVLNNEINSFFDTSAIIENLDLVISADTSVVHLSGAMHKPTWILINYAPDNRWLLNRDDSIWYDAVRLFRQYIDYNWQTVIKNVTKALKKEIKNHK
ncbi:lipopolysaccharide heptosyltransferase I [Avibacterium avium]|uniref:Lipopolysaccharide heptosyltransferase I n=1 Tax=Avibacterium avium TaxID=751 RepID=A0A379AMW1_AVIAV|nr:lipopolysaccharide heptosyltransferase I [Avibacterium avium]